MPDLASFLKSARQLKKLPRASRYEKIRLDEYPFDHQLLTLSATYRESRKQYLEFGGCFYPRISSTMRSLSAQDLFDDAIDYTPSSMELEWFVENVEDIYDPDEELLALERFNTISVFHEQNHRIIWRLLPPAPTEQRDLIRYLNFAEALVVMLDLALGDEIGAKLSVAFEEMKVIYRTGRSTAYHRESKTKYREYLLSMMCATYLILELAHPDDIPNAVDYILPGQKKMNRAAVARAFDINELFTRITNPQWQVRQWKNARTKLRKMHKGSTATALYLPKDPLDLDHEFALARNVLMQFDI